MSKKIHGFTKSEYERMRADAQKEAAELYQWLHDHRMQAPASINRYAECLYTSLLQDLGRYEEQLGQFDPEEF